jgi:Cys-tRNA(Pro) deacylase
MKASVERVKTALERLNISFDLQELPQSTRTAEEAALAVMCRVGQIVKSLIFLNAEGQPLLILTSGANQVDEKLVSQSLGGKIHFASAEIVREETGFSIGGVSPYGLKKQIPIYIDRDLLNFQHVWSAAGSPHAVVRISPADLVETTQGTVISVH